MNAQKSGYTFKGEQVFFCDELMEKANFATFKVLGHGYAKDMNNVYFKGKVLPYVDPYSFKLKGCKVSENTDSGYFIIDGKVFYKGKELDAFPASKFKDLGDGYAVSVFNVFYKGIKIEGASTINFKNIGGGYAQDIRNTYYLGKRIKGK